SSSDSHPALQHPTDKAALPSRVPLAPIRLQWAAALAPIRNTSPHRTNSRSPLAGSDTRSACPTQAVPVLRPPRTCQTPLPSPDTSRSRIRSVPLRDSTRPLPLRKCPRESSPNCSPTLADRPLAPAPPPRLSGFSRAPRLTAPGRILPSPCPAVRRI